MSSSSWLFRLTALSVAALGVALPSFAQSATKVEVAGGYQMLHTDGENLTKGWYADVGVSVGGGMSIVGQVGGAGTSITETQTVSGVRVTVNGDMTVQSFLAGVRFALRRNPKVVPYWHGLTGAVRGSVTGTGSATAGGRTITVSASTGSTELGVQLGGGVNVYFSDHVGVQAGADYLGIMFEDAVSNGFRFATGVVLRFP